MSTPDEAFARLSAIVGGYQQSQAVKVAADLGIADLLRDGPRSTADLAAATATHEATLYRLLRALSSIGVFREEEGRRFSLTAMGDHLRSDAPRSLAPLVRMLLADYEWTAWSQLAHSVRTGENAARHALGMDVWEYRRRHPEHGRTFDAAMRTLSRASAPREIAAYPFARHGVIADVGGGTGSMLAAILRAHPAARGILFDQPHVVAGAPPVLEEAGVADRVTIEHGSFFERVPAGADAYVLRRILHDWPDREATAILRSCRAAMSPEARLVVVDSVLGPPNEDALSKFLDLMMLVSAGGRERTEREWKSLLAAGGFRLERTHPATPTSSVLEAAPA